MENKDKYINRILQITIYYQSYYQIFLGIPLKEFIKLSVTVNVNTSMTIENVKKMKLKKIILYNLMVYKYFCRNNIYKKRFDEDLKK